MKPQSEHSTAYDAVIAALDNAPVGEPLSLEERAELDQIMADVSAGRRTLIRNEDVPAWLEAKACEEGDVAAE
jgi:hypothetical protein